VKSDQVSAGRLAVTAPVADPSRGSTRPSAPPRRLKTSRPPKLRVLVVDDDVRVGKTLARILRDYEVTVVDSAARARALLEAATACDVVFCDLMMPVEHGMDFYRWAATRQPDLACRFVFTTGGTFTVAAREFVEAVPCATIEKPFNSTAIRSAIEVVVSSAAITSSAPPPRGSDE
jgi:DNA-binding NtrC family response regulator